MNSRIAWFATALTGFGLLLVLGCRSMEKDLSTDLLVNPSLHIMVSDHHPVPSKGSFDFESKLFKVADSVEFELAAAEARITHALEAELERRGFVRDRENPDLRLSYAVAADSGISHEDLSEAYADEFPIVVPEPDPQATLDYVRGVLICDFVDNRSRKLLWRGAILAEVDMDVSDDTKVRRAGQAARTLLAHFPKPVTK